MASSKYPKLLVVFSSFSVVFSSHNAALSSSRIHWDCSGKENSRGTEITVNVNEPYVVLGS